MYVYIYIYIYRFYIHTYIHTMSNSHIFCVYTYLVLLFLEASLVRGFWLVVPKFTIQGLKVHFRDCGLRLIHYFSFHGVCTSEVGFGVWGLGASYLRSSGHEKSGFLFNL